MDAFEKELKISFLQEALQHLISTEECFLQLEKNFENQQLLEQIFRLAHNLKGSASAVGFNDLGHFTHEFENLLIRLKNKECRVDSNAVSLLLACNDHLKKWVNGLFQDFNYLISSEFLITSIQNFGQPESQNLIKDDDLISHLQFTSPATDSSNFQDYHLIEDHIRVPLSRLEVLMNNVGELVILQTVLNQQKHQIQSPLIQRTVMQLNKITKDIQDISLGLRMLPLKQTFQKMERIVRDSSFELEKEIQFVTDGEETEIDKTVIEKIGDPLVHLIRNAVDHGIESPDEREKLGKSRKGRISLRAFHTAGKIVIQIRDDGRGLDPQLLRAKAIEKGLIDPLTVLTDKEAQHLIFMPGFSTKTTATDLSGRGVGMDVVKTNIEHVLRGEIFLHSQPGMGTQLDIHLPLTLAIIEGLVIQNARQKYILPLFQVQESLRLSSVKIHKSTTMGAMITLRGEEVPLLNLKDLLSIRSFDAKPVEECIAVIVRTAGATFAIAIDDVLGQHQVVIKSLGPEMKNIKGFAGGAILGDGKAALILDLPELLTSRSQRHKKNDSAKEAS